MSRRIDQSKLRTLKDVHRAQKAVARRINYIEDELVEDYGELSEMLSVDYWVEKLIGRLPVKLIPVVQSGYAAYAFVRSLLGKN